MKRLKYMPVGEHIGYTVKNRKLLFLLFSLRWLLLNTMPWLAEKGMGKRRVCFRDGHGFPGGGCEDDGVAWTNNEVVMKYEYWLFSAVR